MKRPGNKQLNHFVTNSKQYLLFCRKFDGYAMRFITYCSWIGKSMYLEDLYVRLNYRNEGIGQLLFEQIKSYSRKKGCKKLEFHVSNWNPAIKFYKNMGATYCDEKAGKIHFKIEIIKFLISINIFCNSCTATFLKFHSCGTSNENISYHCVLNYSDTYVSNGYYT